MGNAETKLPHQLVDWKEFEIFIADLYRKGDDVTVQHNVTEVGKSGAKRQIDVLVYQRTPLHNLKIIIECKCWKTKVDRQVIDVLYSSVEDLNASKGVIFTTKGFEEGAVKYAESKNIDIFTVRDLTESDWGRPGREILMYVQTYSGALKNIQFDNVQFISTNGLGPQNTHIDLGISLNEQALSNEKYNLVALDTTKPKVHLVKLFKQIHSTLLKQLSDSVKDYLQPMDQRIEIGYKTPVMIDFRDQTQKHLIHENGFLSFDTITFDFYQTITQSKIVHDRSCTSDFILMVENYISEKKYFAAKNKQENAVRLSEVKTQENNVPTKDTWQNGNILKVPMDFTVDGTPSPDAKVIETPLRNIKLNVVDPKNASKSTP